VGGALRARGVSPYRLNSPVHVSDWHRTILSMASSTAAPSIQSATPQQQAFVVPEGSEKASNLAHRLHTATNNNNEATGARRSINDDLHLYDEGVDQWPYLIQGEEEGYSPPRELHDGASSWHYSTEEATTDKRSVLSFNDDDPYFARRLRERFETTTYLDSESDPSVRVLERYQLNIQNTF
jgi:hypothetical protein